MASQAGRGNRVSDTVAATVRPTAAHGRGGSARLGRVLAGAPAGFGG